MAELVDAPDSKSGAFGRGGSSPPSRTTSEKLELAVVLQWVAGIGLALAFAFGNAIGYEMWRSRRAAAKRLDRTNTRPKTAG